MTFTLIQKGNFKNIENKLIKKGNHLNSFIITLARTLNKNIKSRVVNKGVGSFGKMPLYANAYSLARKKAGLTTNIRTLKETGKMWRALTAEELTKNKARMFFTGAQQNSKAFFNETRTPFFSITTEESNIIKRELQKEAKL